MFKRLLFGAGAAWLARKFMGRNNRRSSGNYSRSRSRNPFGSGRRRSGFGF